MSSPNLKKYVYPHLKWGEKTQVKRLLSYTPRDLSHYTKVIDYVKKHKVVLTFTTSPKRIRHVPAMLSLLDLTHVDRIYLSIPKKYRNKTPYPKTHINAILKMDSRIRVLETAKDMGPLTKMFPTLSGQVRDPNTIVISLDDDIGYPRSLINELIYHAVTKPDQVHTGVGFNLGDYAHEKYYQNHRRRLWPNPTKPRGAFVDVVEGWSGVAYKKKFLNFPFLKKLNQSGIVCKLSDDLTISYMLAKKNVRCRVVETEYFNWEMLYPFKYGLEGDALHQGSGTDLENQNVAADEMDANMVKYKNCLNLLHNMDIHSNQVGGMDADEKDPKS